jgi:hypothetical protein
LKRIRDGAASVPWGLETVVACYSLTPPPYVIDYVRVGAWEVDDRLRTGCFSPVVSPRSIIYRNVVKTSKCKWVAGPAGITNLSEFSLRINVDGNDCGRDGVEMRVKGHEAVMVIKHNGIAVASRGVRIVSVTILTMRPGAAANTDVPRSARMSTPVCPPL